MKNVLLSLVLILSAFIGVNADDFESEGIRYSTIKLQFNNEDNVYYGVEVIAKGKSVGYEGDIVIPNSVTYMNEKYLVIGIGNGAFSKDEKLSSVILPDSLMYIGEGAFQYCTGLKNINLPNSIRQIDRHVFDGCHKIKKIVLPNLLVKLNSIFGWNRGLREIVIPSSIKRIDYSTFYSCEKLRKISLCGVNPPFLETGIDGCFGGIEPRKISLYVPQEAIEDYREAVGWRDFNIKIGECDELP